MNDRPKIAIWFRYGPAEHAELFHAMPEIVRRLAEHTEVHYFGLRSSKPIPEMITSRAVIHNLPFHINRTSSADKWLKTILWLLCLPIIALKCRWLRMKLVYIDETVPLAAMIGRVFYGRNVVITVADFFVLIYMGKNRLLSLLGRFISAVDFAAWRRLPLIFTRANYTKTFLVQKGFDPRRIMAVYDPCDFLLYHPGGRESARAEYHYQDDHVVLVSHGIMHPNKGNDRIIQWVSDLREQCPFLRLLLIGDGPDMPRLKQMVCDLQAEDIIRFTGWLKTPAQVNKALNAGDIGLVMRAGQESDNFHTTGALVHSLACGLPVLAARLGGVAEIVRENETGLLFDPNSKEEFNAKLMTLTRSRDVRRRYGAAGYKLAKELFDIQAVTDATVRPLLALLQ